MSVELPKIYSDQSDEEFVPEHGRMQRNLIPSSPAKCDIVTNFEPIECPLCFLIYGPQEGIVLRNCLHAFCRACISKAIKYCEEAEVKCPFWDAKYTCESTLQEREIKALAEPEIYQQHLNKSITPTKINEGINSLRCKTFDCPGWFIFDENSNIFMCPECGQNNYIPYQDENEEDQITHEATNTRNEAPPAWIENDGVLLNSSIIECPLCFLTYGPHEGIHLRDCLHAFCRACIRNKINLCEEAEIQCPFWDGEFVCESKLQEREIKALVDPEVYEQHLEKTVAQAAKESGNTFYCRTPKCPGWCIYDDNVNNFLCPVCGVNNCLTDQIIKEEDENLSEEERIQRYEARISLENCGVILNSEPFECPLCFYTHGPQEGVVLRYCLHIFCRPCIARTITYCEEPDVKCPFWDSEYTCESTFQEREIKTLVDAEIYEQHLAKSIIQVKTKFGNVYHCKTPDCPGWCVYDNNVNEFLCPLCNVNNCLTDQIIMEEDEEELTSEEVRIQRQAARLTLQNCGIILNTETIECPICFNSCGPQEGVILFECLHSFCRPCIADLIRHCEEATVMCPFVDDENNCDATLHEREIRALVEPEIYQKHLAKSIVQAEGSAGRNAFHCKTPDCHGWCFHENDADHFWCPVCNEDNCFTCEVAHTGKTCEQYKAELELKKETQEADVRTAAALEQMLNTGQALRCPTCGVIVQKTTGCDGMECVMCKTHLCWATKGARWGPRGPGDISGGCRCRVNGRYCHPNCRGCH